MSTTARAPASASASRSVPTVRAAPGSGSGWCRTMVTGERNGSSSRSSSVARPPPPTTVTGWSNRVAAAGSPQDRARARIGSWRSPASSSARACSATGSA